MEVRCDKCQARYRVDDARIGPQGLTMRCGKCQNTFKVTRPAAAPEAAPAPAPRPAAAKPAPKAIEPAPNATMVFGQSPVRQPAAPAMPAKPAAPAAGAKPAPAPAVKPAPASAAKPAGAAAAPPADEGAGRTMMFQTGNLKAPAPKPRPPDPDTGATMVFGQSPMARPAAAPPAAKPAPKPDDTGATMVFGQSPVAKPLGQAPAAARAVQPPPPAPAPVAPPIAQPEPHPEPAAEEPRAAAGASAVAEREARAPEEPIEDERTSESGVEAEGAEEEEAEAPAGTFDKAPPKGLLIGVAAGLAALLIAGGTLVAVKKLGRRPPPPAAVETLTSAQADADKDTLASIASAEGKAKDALDVAGPRAYFPEATATLARVEVQWADALYDQASQLAAKGDEAKAGELQTQAKGKLKAAFEALAPAIKADPKSPDLQLALADYYRAQRSNTNMNKALKSAQALKADDARVSLVQGMAFLQEEDGAEKAIPKLKAALAAGPQSARVHFRLAQAYLAVKDEANASAELKETLKLSPQHERAKAATDQMAATAAAK